MPALELTLLTKEKLSKTQAHAFSVKLTPKKCENRWIYSKNVVSLIFKYVRTFKKWPYQTY